MARNNKAKNSAYSANNNAAAKAVVAENLKRNDKVKLADIVEIIRPMYIWTKSELVESALKIKARYIMSQFRDSKNVRIFYSDSKGVYINVENSTDLKDLDEVDTQLSVKYTGLSAAMDKVRDRIDSVVEKFRRKK